ncbi:CoA transferase [Alkalihalobacterium alkalinitrilicum]|uniref:CoA transferase n=1 Tax=Alkalihalobacterium alkalinitrilicum TaxID=427920 RepID=UPI001C57A3F4|nr:CoA transferase [Alkalihalobacterium alkalinitrilicum]
MGILSGLKILDFSTLLPGTFATMMLADMGAEAVKVETLPVRWKIEYSSLDST